MQQKHAVLADRHGASLSPRASHALDEACHPCSARVVREGAGRGAKHTQKSVKKQLKTRFDLKTSFTFEPRFHPRFPTEVHQAPLPCRTCACTAWVPLLAIRSIFLASHTAACYLPSGSPLCFPTLAHTRVLVALTAQRSLPARVTVLRGNPLYCWGKCGGQRKVLAPLVWRVRMRVLVVFVHFQCRCERLLRAGLIWGRQSTPDMVTAVRFGSPIVGIERMGLPS